jgi:Protein of unknown function (DUF2795)
MKRAAKGQKVTNPSAQSEKVPRKSKVIENGDIYFFYRPKVGTEEVKDIENIQRFYMVLSPEYSRIHRVFLVGQKQLPEIAEGQSTSEERNWALNIMTTTDVEVIRKEFLPAEYRTKTKGIRRMGGAIPAGEGKYLIVEHEGHSELAYVLELPEVPGPAQNEFQVKKEASYIISVKNPDIQIAGYSAFLNRKPNYPKTLREKFGNRRWINVDDHGLIDYQNAQLVLIGARENNVEEELGIDINHEKETTGSAELFKDLKMKKDQVPLNALFQGEFPDKNEIPLAQEVNKLPPHKAPGRGGKIGGKIASNYSASAAALAKILSGIHFPKRKEALIEYAKQNRSNVLNPTLVIDLLKDLPNRNFGNMADVEKAMGEVR